MNVLIACEESQRVCIVFRNKGHMALTKRRRLRSQTFPGFANAMANQWG